MKREEAIELVDAAFDAWENEYSTGDDWSEEHEARDMAIKALEHEQRWDKLYSWLNDMWLGIAPDETVTDIDERNVRTAQVDLLDEIMKWIDESQEGSDKG